MSQNDTPSHFSTPSPVVLVGLMGAGKSAIGKRLAERLGAPFVDSDDEIVMADGRTIPEIFEQSGETFFRELERRVIADLFQGGVKVIATGGGAFMNPETRARIKAGAVSVWLRAELDVLVERTSRKDTRPLLQGKDHREVLGRLMEERYPVYAEADVVVESDERPHDEMVDAVIDALASQFKAEKEKR